MELHMYFFPLSNLLIFAIFYLIVILVYVLLLVIHYALNSAVIMATILTFYLIMLTVKPQIC